MVFLINCLTKGDKMAAQYSKHLPYDNEICTKLITATAYNLKKFRLENKMTQERLAAKLSIYLKQRYSYQQIQKYESTNQNKNKIPLIVGFAFAKILNRPLESFFISKEDFENKIIFNGTLQPEDKTINE